MVATLGQLALSSAGLVSATSSRIAALARTGASLALLASGRVATASRVTQPLQTLVLSSTTIVSPTSSRVAALAKTLGQLTLLSSGTIAATRVAALAKTLGPLVVSSTGTVVAAQGGADPGFTNQRTGVLYGDFQSAHDAAQNGDTLLINPTNYGSVFWEVDKSLTLKSSVPGQKWQVGPSSAGHTSILNHYLGVNQTLVVEDGYFAFYKQHPNFYGGPTNAPLCIDWEGTCVGSFTIRNCKFEDCPMPILTSRFVTDVLIENCEFKNCGSTDNPNTHCLYVHATNSLTVRGNWFHWTYTVPTGSAPIPAAAPWSSDNTWIGVGHNVKSRSRNTTVEANLFDNRLGSTSAMIDIGEAGALTVEGNIILEGPYSSNDPTSIPEGGYSGDNQIMSYINGGVSGNSESGPAEWPAGALTIRQNTIVNYGQATERVVRTTVGSIQPSSYDVQQNIIAGSLADVPNANYPSGSNSIYTPTTGIFVDAAGGNFAPLSGVAGTHFAQYAYAAPTGYVARTDAFRGAVPPAPGLPAYIAAHPVGEWFDVLPGTTLDSVGNNVACMQGQNFSMYDNSLDTITNYSGGAVRESGSWLLLKGGGHNSTLNNILMGIRLSVANPAWEVISPCTPQAQIQPDFQSQTNWYARYLDGKMSTGHSAYRDWFLQRLDRYVQIGAGVSYLGNGGSPYIDTFDWNQKGSASSTAGWAATNMTCADAGYYGGPNWVFGDTIYSATPYQLYRAAYTDPALTYIGNFRGSSTSSEQRYGACFVDPVRGFLVWGGLLDPVYGATQQLTQIGVGSTPGRVLDLSGVTVPPSPYGGGIYEPFLDRYLLLMPGSSQVYSVHPDTGVVTNFPTNGTLAWPASRNTVMTRFQYLPELKCVVFQEASEEYHGRLMMMRTG